MKKSTQEIISYFPSLKDYLQDNENILLTDEALSKLNDTEQVFLRLAWFFENPDKENFNLETIYKKLDGEWLSFALQVIFEFFEKDTYLLQETKFSVITEGSVYYNLADFARYLTNNGCEFSRQKLNVYVKRGVTPDPDIIVAGVRYWAEGTVESFLHYQKVASEQQLTYNDYRDRNLKTVCKYCGSKKVRLEYNSYSPKQDKVKCLDCNREYYVN